MEEMVKKKRGLRSRIVIGFSCFLTFFLCSLWCVLPASAASADVNTLISVVDGQIGSAGNANNCLGWVASAFYTAYGLNGNVYSSCCAYHNSLRWVDSTSSTNIPVGAAVYFSGGNCICGNGGTCGHVGIYVGDGYIVHLVDMGDGYGTRVHKTLLSHIINNWTWYTYLGWGWYADLELVDEIEITLDCNGGALENPYTEWSGTKTSVTQPVESDYLQITDTGTQYHYFHYHNTYGGYSSNLDSIAYGSNWGHCEYDSSTQITQSMGFSDQGGRTSVKIGPQCQHGYTYWFEDIQTVYYYRTRDDATKRTVNTGSPIGALPIPVRSGYTFEGWYTAAAGGNKMDETTVAGGNNLTLYARWEEAACVLYLDCCGGSLGDAAYTTWSETKTAAAKPAESVYLKIVDTVRNYHYFHYHNTYGGYATNLDSIAYGSNWGYCEHDSSTQITQSMGFSDQGGRTGVKIGPQCQYGYTYWFEDVRDTYYYQTREDAEFKVSRGSAIGPLPTPVLEGHIFGGWYTAENDGEKVSDETIADSETLNLYARWIPTVKWGDVNGDGEVTAYDASLILQHNVGLITLTDAQLAVGDVSDDGATTAYDASLILQINVGLIDCFPVEKE